MQTQEVNREMSLDPTVHLPTSLYKSSRIKPVKFDKRGKSIQDRLHRLGHPLKWKASIRIAPLKDSGLPLNILESKVPLIEKWLTNLKGLKSDLPLPEIESVSSKWEIPRDGDRVKIVRICFKTETGIGIMKDLMYGSKLNLVEGFPEELETLRDKIYVSESRPRRSQSNYRF